MKLPSNKATIGNKDKIIEVINEFFDTEFISKTARLKQFVERESKDGWLIFFLCVFTAKKDRTTSLDVLCRDFTKMGLKSGNKVCKSGIISQ